LPDYIRSCVPGGLAGRNKPLHPLSNRHLLSNSEERTVKIPVFVMVLAAAMLTGLGLIFFVL
jgi:hypothetical protein